jgi:hypothetical protein
MSLTARALLWRRGASATLLAVAAVTTTAAALAPTYAQAASESTLRDRLTGAPAPETGLELAAKRVDASQPTAVSDVRALGPRPGSLVGYPTSTASVQAYTSVEVGDVKVLGQAVWREGFCAHVVVVKGRCPTGPHEGMVSQRSAGGGYGLRLGGVVALDDLDVVRIGQFGYPEYDPVHVRVVGLYRPRDPTDAYWFGHSYFNAHLYNGRGDYGPDTIDAVMVDRSLFPTLARPTTAEIDVDFPLDPRQVRLGDEPRLRHEVAAAESRYTQGGDVTLSSSLPAVLDAADKDRSLLQVSTVLVAVQLGLLAWLVLFQVMGDAAEARGNEIALAKLRGLPPRSTIVFGLAEPMLLLAIAVPLGLLGAWLVTAVMGRLVLAPGTPVTLTWGSLAGALVGFAGGAVAAALAARKVLTRPVLEQWRRVPDQVRHGAASLVGDLVLLGVAVAGLVALRDSVRADTEPRPVSLLAPGLLVLAVAVLGVRLLPFAARAALLPTRAGPRVGAFLAVRQVVRRPSGLRLATLLAVAIGLATFAVDAQAVAADNRQNRAGLELGADQVVRVEYQTGHDPLVATHKADPDGRWAMAAATWLPAGGPVTGTVLAVDSSRLRSVAYWPAEDLGPADAAAQVGEPVPPPLVVRGTGLSVTADLLQKGPGPPPNLTAELRPTGKRPVLVQLGALRPGQHTYTAAVSCAGGCRVSSLVLDRPIDFFTQMRGTVLVSSLAQRAGGAWQPLDARLNGSGNWRAAGTPYTSHDTLTVTPQGLSDTYTSTGGASPAMGHVDSPQPLPVIGTPNGLRRDPSAGAPAMLDTTLTSAMYQETSTTPLLPGVLDDGVLVDLSYLRDQLVDFDDEASWQVWLGPNAPKDAINRLTRAGLVVQGDATRAQRVELLSRQGPALALVLLVACAVAGAALAAGATALAVAVTGRRRAFELAALQAVGVRRRSLRRSCVGEQLLLLGTALVLGVPAGVVAAHLALPAIPEYSDHTPVPPDFAPHVAAVTAFVLAVTALLVVIAVVAGRLLMRSAVPTRLREATQ